MKLRVGVIFGGRSGEHEISVRSAQTVLEQLDPEKYDAVPIAITPEGQWLNPRESLGLLPQTTAGFVNEETASMTSGAVAVIGDTRYKGLTRLDAVEDIAKLDVIFPVLHGTYGEDGTIQGLIEMADLPYVGCGVLGSACGMDKTVMKVLFKEAGLPICRHIWFLRSEWERL
ncbi:MAG: D-alanine--D-alanine ligase A, partial [Acidobacteriota bacterium]